MWNPQPETFKVQPKGPQMPSSSGAPNHFNMEGPTCANPEGPRCLDPQTA